MKLLKIERISRKDPATAELVFIAAVIFLIGVLLKTFLNKMGLTRWNDIFLNKLGLMRWIDEKVLAIASM